MTNVAVYARVSSDRQKKNETIVSQTAALRERAHQMGATLSEEWVFEDDGHSGGTLSRPALEPGRPAKSVSAGRVPCLGRVIRFVSGWIGRGAGVR